MIATAWFKRNIKSAFQDVRKEVSNINTFVQEHIVGMNLVQIFNREHSEFEKFKKINKNHLKTFKICILLFCIFSNCRNSFCFSIGLIIWYGGESIISGKEVTLGELVAFYIIYIYDVSSYSTTCG